MKSIAAMFVLPLIAAIAACESGAPTVSAPRPAYGSGCRCDGNAFHLALVRVETDPVAERDELGGGLGFEVTVESLLPATAILYRRAPAPEVGRRVRARYYLTTPDGTPIPNLIPGHPSLPAPQRQMRLYVQIGVTAIDDQAIMSVEPLPVDMASDTLTFAWMQFAPGTSATRILQPIEWNNPERGCLACRSTLGDSAVAPLDAIAAPDGR